MGKPRTGRFGGIRQTAGGDSRGKARTGEIVRDDNHVSTRLLKLHEQVSQPYVDAVAPTIRQQIAKAGVRLAMVLNQIWP